MIEPRHGLVGIARRGEGVEQHGQQLGQVRPRRRGAGRRIAAIVPLAHRGRGLARIGEPHLGQRFERAGVVVTAGEDKVAAGAAERGPLDEQVGIIGDDAGERVLVALLERLGVGIAHQRRDGRDPGVVFRHDVRLLVAQHLQPVLDRAQEPVDFGEVGGDVLANPAGAGERRQRLGGRTHPQGLVSPAGDQLLRLGEELDLADAAESELHIVPLDPDVADLLGDVDLALHRLDVGDGREVEMLAPDIGGQIAQEGLADAEVPGTGPCLDPGGAFPVLAAPLVVGQGRLDRQRHRRRARVRPQPEVGAKDIAGLRPVLHEAGQLLDHAGKVPGRLHRVLERRPLRLEEGHYIDVAGVVELSPAVLAEGKQRQPRVGCPALAVEQAARPGQPHQYIEARFERGVRKIGERGGRLRRRPVALDLGDRGKERHPRLGQPHGLADLHFVLGGAPCLGDLRQHGGKRRIGVRGCRDQPLAVLFAEIAQVGSGIEQRFSVDGRHRHSLF